MQLGLIGLGKMGGNMAERLRLGGHQVVGFDFNADTVAKLTASGNGLYVGTDQSVGSGNMGIPIQAGVWLDIPANCNLFITSAGVALAQATSIYLMQLFMGATTLAGAEVGGG